MPSPRSNSRIQPATLSRKYRSCVTAMTVPGKFCRYCSNQWTDSASRWLVGSSSSRISGLESNRRARATRRRSPPERTSTFSSSGGQRRASSAVLILLSSSQALRFSSSSISSPCRSMSLFISSSDIGSENFRFTASYSFIRSTVSCTPSSTISRTVFPASSCGSCSR